MGNNKKTKLTANDYAATISILESLNDAIFICDSKALIQYANTSAAQLVKKEFNYLIGKNILDAIPIVKSEKSFDLIKTDDFSTRFKSFDYNAVVTIKNEKLNVKIGFNPILNNSNNIDYVIIKITNTTFENLISKERRQSQFVSITKEQMSVFSDSLVSIVHELSQPLQALNLKIELIKNKYGNKDASLSQEIDELKYHTQKIIDVVNISRSYSQSAESSDYAEVALNEIIETLSKNFNYDFQKYKIGLQVNLPNEDIVCLSKSDLLIDALTKIISSILTTSNNSNNKVIVISLSKSQNDIAIISILDNFIHHEDSYYNDCFNFHKSEINLSGISLPIAKEIIEGFGGTIDLFKKNKGSEFIINLPLYLQNERAQLLNLMDIQNNE